MGHHCLCGCRGAVASGFIQLPWRGFAAAFRAADRALWPGLVEPLDLGQGLQTIVGLLVSLVLFDGGLNLRLPGDTIKATVLRISVLRIFISLGAGILAAHWLAGLSWSLAAVFSAIVLATGPTVVTPIVKQIRLAHPLGDVLEAEGLLLEPIGAVLALLLLELAAGQPARLA